VCDDRDITKVHWVPLPCSPRRLYCGAAKGKSYFSDMNPLGADLSTKININPMTT